MKIDYGYGASRVKKELGDLVPLAVIIDNTTYVLTAERGKLRISVLDHKLCAISGPGVNVMDLKVLDLHE